MIGCLLIAQRQNFSGAQCAAVDAHLPDISVEIQSVIALRSDEQRALAGDPGRNASEALDLAAIPVDAQYSQRLIEDCGGVNPLVDGQSVAIDPVVRPTCCERRRSPLSRWIRPETEPPLRSPCRTNLRNPRRVRCGSVWTHQALTEIEPAVLRSELPGNSMNAPCPLNR